jgi:predicted Zn-dependent protease
VPSTEPKPAPGAGTDTPPTQPAPLEAPQGIDPQLEEKRVKERGKLLTVPELAETLRHGRTIDQLGPEDKRRVSQLIDEGEAGLRAGDYFKAERRFDQARILTPGNPLIEVGMAHAQLGAGLYLSASLTLRNLFTERPELIDAKYDRALLPAQDRLDKAIAVMRERVKLGDDVQGYGLVLAYIGHQTGNAALVEEGLSSIQGTPAYDSVRELLGGVWMPKK